MELVELYTNHEEYNAQSAAENSMTVEELIDYLSHFDSEAKVVFCNDRGYTYGYVNSNYIRERWVDDEEDEE